MPVAGFAKAFRQTSMAKGYQGVLAQPYVAPNPKCDALLVNKTYALSGKLHTTGIICLCVLAPSATPCHIMCFANVLGPSEALKGIHATCSCCCVAQYTLVAVVRCHQPVHLFKEDEGNTGV